MKYIFITILLFLFIRIDCFCQSTQIDSLKNELKFKNSTVKQIGLLCDLSSQLLYTDTTNAHKYLNQAIVLGSNTNDDYSKGLINFSIGNFIFICQTSGNKPRKYFEIAQKYFQKVTNEKGVIGQIKVSQAFGDLFLYEGNLDSALVIFLKVIKLSEKINTNESKLILSYAYNSVGAIYHYLGQDNEGLVYKKKTVEILESLGRKSHDLIMAYLQTAYLYIMLKKPVETKQYLEKGKIILDSVKTDNEALMQYYEVSCRYYLFVKDFEKAISEQKNALENAQKIGNISYVTTQKYMLANAYFSAGQYANAKEEFLNCIPLAEQLNDNRIKLKIYSHLSECEEKLGNTASALKYLKIHSKLDDSLKFEETKQSINNLETKYKTAKKEKQIIQLEKQKQNQTVLIFSLLTGLLVLIITSGLTYNYLNQKNINAEQKLLQLQQEKELEATKNILQVQEEERVRVAKDLHDGLGSMLSGIKLNLSAMKGNVILQQQDAGLFVKSIEQLDNAISEMRRVAHNMMPESLLKFGLSQALQDYCESMNESKVIQLTFKDFGLNQRLENSTEIVLYRIIQELVNNAIKHAQAQHIFIQLVKNENNITLTVEDDGKGFDINKLDNLKGFGLTNIQSRVDYLKGNLEIDSQQNVGTSFYITLPV